MVYGADQPQSAFVHLTNIRLIISHIIVCAGVRSKYAQHDAASIDNITSKKNRQEGVKSGIFYILTVEGRRFPAGGRKSAGQVREGADTDRPNNVWCNFDQPGTGQAERPS